MKNIQNPLSAVLPNQIAQNNLISTEGVFEIKTETPMFTGVETTKKGGYMMAEDVREMVS